MPVRVKTRLSLLLLSGVPLRTAWPISRGTGLVTPYMESCIRWQVREARRWWWRLLPVF